MADLHLNRDDEKQLMQLKSGMSRYGIPIIIALVLALVGYLGWQWWQKQQQIKAANLTMQYYNLAKQAENPTAKTAGDGQKIVTEAPDSVQALQSQLLLAKLAFDKKDYAQANKILTQASASKVADEGLKSVAKLHLAYTQMAQNQPDAALKTLNGITHAAFIPSVAEAKGDIYLLQNKPDAAKTAYQQAWEVLKQRQQPRELLQLKLADLGVTVDMPPPESPIATPSVSTVATAPTEGSAAP